MLISHKYKFIYFKGVKCASTSVDSFFQRYCVHDLGLLNCNRPDARRRCSDDRPTEYQDEVISDVGMVGSRGHGKYKHWYGHMRPNAVMRKLEELYPNQSYFEDYFKFAVVRNPWDRAVSLYHWQGWRDRIPFRRYCRDVLTSQKEQYYFYQLGKGMLGKFDYWVKFENLKEGVRTVGHKLGISDELLELSRFSNYKSGSRICKHYTEYYTPEIKRMVDRVFYRDIQFWDYTFGE